MRRQDLGQQRVRIARSRLALDAHPGLDQVTAVEDFERRPRAAFQDDPRAAGRGTWRRRRLPRASGQQEASVLHGSWVVASGSYLHCIALELDLEVGRREHRLECLQSARGDGCRHAGSRWPRAARRAATRSAAAARSRARPRRSAWRRRLAVDVRHRRDRLRPEPGRVVRRDRSRARHLPRSSIEICSPACPVSERPPRSMRRPLPSRTLSRRPRPRPAARTACRCRAPCRPA